MSFHCTNNNYYLIRKKLSSAKFTSTLTIQIKENFQFILASSFKLLCLPTIFTADISNGPQSVQNNIWVLTFKM